MAMLPQSSVGQMDREIQTRPPAERQSQLLKYLLWRVCTTINVNSSPHSAAYVRRWIGSALLQIMVCGGGVGWGGGVGVGGGGWLTERESSKLPDHRNAFSILMFGLIFTSFIGTFYGRSQWHWIKYLNIIDVMVWFKLAAITWAIRNQYFICCYKATMNSVLRRDRFYEMVTKEGYIGWTGYSS